ncbi:MAG: hypothetical protein M5U19_06755 [Microthrixaceae bacterium]|nr:hypothetical protein [Microthrixaceae bacterium]
MSGDENHQVNGLRGTRATVKAAVFVTAFALLSSSGFATDASAGVCGDDTVADTPPRSRPYRLGADKHPRRCASTWR